MASFVPPQVDHNLYTPILPQDNVQQIFSLLDQKQQMYNQGVKSAQHKISSMLSLEKDVTSDPVKNMVTDFNGKANDLIKQYANLDFSLQGNVKLIDNIYDPLLSNEVFLNDYTATKNYKNEMQKAYGYRDSTDEKTRNLFNQKNLDVLNIKRQDLSSAQTEKDIKTYSSRLANTSYTPYYDYNAELLGYMKDHKDIFEMSVDQDAGQYIITHKNGPQRYDSIKSFVDTFLSDKSRNQMEIEEGVDFANAVRTSGTTKEQYLSQQISSAQDTYEKSIQQTQASVEKVKDQLGSYPSADRLNTKQKAEVEKLKQDLTAGQKILEKGQSVLSNFNDFMTKAANGEVDLSRFYDVAENLVVSDNVDKKINNMAIGLLGKETITIKENTAYSHMMTENRLRAELQHKIEQDRINNSMNREKTLLEAAAEGLVSAYYDPETQSFVFGEGSGGEDGSSFIEPSQEGTGDISPTDINGINTALEAANADQSANTISSSMKVIQAYSSLKNTPLNNAELTTLGTIVRQGGLNSTMQSLVQKYKTNPAALAVLKKAGLTGNLGLTLGSAMGGIVTNAENYIRNTSLDQAGNKSGYYKDLKATLQDHSTKSTMLTVEKNLLVNAVKSSLVKFEKDNPQWKGRLSISANGKIVEKKLPSSFTDKAFSAIGGVSTWLQELVTDDDNLTPTQKKNLESSRAMVSPAEAFNSYLKTQKGALGNTGSYFQKTVASNQGTFNWLQQNKNLYVNQPSSYELSMDEYRKSKYYQGNKFDTDNTELKILTDIQGTFLNSIKDSRYKLANKNLMTEGNKVVTRAGETIVYPNLQYLKYIYNLVDKDGKPTDIRAGITDTEDYDSFDDMLEAVAKNGIKIKTPGSQNKASLNLQGYLNSGEKLPISKSNAGSTANFTLAKSSNGSSYALEGMFKDSDDFFIDQTLTYKLDQSKASLRPYSNSSAFNYYRYDLLPSQVDESILNTTNNVADLQLFFNQQKDSPEFIQNLMQYIKGRNSSTSQISGQLILEYLKTIYKA